VPVDPVHPDPEELAAWQAGDLPGRGGVRVEAHVAGCADCARVVATVERGRAALADLVEVELPTGLHERLASAIQREAVAIDREAAAPAGVGDGDGVHERHLVAAADGVDGEGERRSAAAAARGDALDDSAPIAEPIMLDGRRHGRRSPAGRRRIAVLSAAAVILLVVGLVPVLRHLGGQTVATQGAGSGAATAPGAARESTLEALPVFPAPEGYSGTALQSALASDPAARSAYQRAASGVPGAQPLTRDGRSAPVNPQLKSDSGDDAAGPSGGSEATAGAQALAGSQKVACVMSAQSSAGDQSLRPAFFVDTVYRGRPATVLVMVRPGAPDRAELWAFPRDNCSAPPFAHDRVTVSPP
jgi:hypothetical protein